MADRSCWEVILELKLNPVMFLNMDCTTSATVFSKNNLDIRGKWNESRFIQLFELTWR